MTVTPRKEAMTTKSSTERTRKWRANNVEKNKEYQRQYKRKLRAKLKAQK